MALPPLHRPKTLVADLRGFLGGEHRHKLLVGALAICMPAIIVYGFIRDGRTNILPGRSIIYVQNWRADRTDAEIIAQQKIDQKARDAAAAEKRASYQRLAKRLGIE
ncbi:MAG: hypothetical protein PGN09_09445 [Sphingomonas fennica]